MQFVRNYDHRSHNCMELFSFHTQILPSLDDESIPKPFVRAFKSVTTGQLKEEKRDGELFLRSGALP